MVKTTKRSRKFNAKGGTKALEKKGTSLTKKGKTKRPGGKAKNQDGAKTKKEEVDSDVEERERASNDFLNVDNLGKLDMDSFFEKAVGLVDGDDDDSAASDDDSSVQEDDAVAKAGTQEDDDDDSSVDSYASLGSEEEDIAASEARMKRQLDKLSKNDPEFHKYLKENESDLLEFGDDDEEEEMKRRVVLMRNMYKMKMPWLKWLPKWA